MHRWTSDPEPWYIVPIKPGADASFRRSNLVIICILAAVVLGLSVAAIFPRATGSPVHKVRSHIEHVT